ncbi:MAG: L,D-transpeptidase [Gammaproteobacteria bacterium]|nr:L,D-transpeptidase [Gammaproteobacteria bacterium]
MHTNQPQILVNLARQQLLLLSDGQIIHQYPVNTAKNGPGERINSECTPRGKHKIRAKIGAGEAKGRIFVGRRPTGEIYSPALDRAHPDRDWILSRILWLSGLEPGVNRLGDVDTMRRYIYIHGSPDHCVTSDPQSHGCIRMKNVDIIDLFEQVPVGTQVDIL